MEETIENVSPQVINSSPWAARLVRRFFPGQANALWRDADFLKLWGGETISLFGSQISSLALPLTAAISLRASPGQMGYLNTARFAPFLLLTLLAGVWVDRRAHRPVLVWTNTGRFLLMGLIPLLAVLGKLNMSWLYILSFAVGILTVFFELAYQAYLPRLVRREQITNANSMLQASASAAEIGGPGLAGILISLLTAPLAILFDAISFLFSAGMLFNIRHREPALDRPPQDRHLLAEIRQGLEVTFGNPYLRAIAGEAATYNLFWQVSEVVFVLYATRQLGLGPGMLGLIISTGSIGALLGSVLAPRLAKRYALGPTILGSMIVGCFAPTLIVLARPGSSASVVLPVLSFFVGGIGVAISNVHVVSLRQSVTPDELLGRMTASYRTVIYGALPLGALLGGFLGEKLGLRPALAVGALGMLLALPWVIFSPLRRLRTL